MPEIIPIDKEKLLKKSQRLEITLFENEYIFEFYYNSQEEYFTFDLYKNNTRILCGRRIVYAQDILYDLRLDFKVIPISQNNNIKEITKDNFLDSVQLFVVKD